MTKKKGSPRDVHNGWYEVTETFTSPERIRNVQEAEGARVFLLGRIEGVVIVEVPADMPGPAARDALGRALTERLKGSVLIVNESIKFMKLRRATAEQERILYGHTKEEAAAARAASAAAHPIADDGDRSLVAADGALGDRLDGEHAARGDDRHEEDGGSGAHRADS